VTILKIDQIGMASSIDEPLVWINALRDEIKIFIHKGLIILQSKMVLSARPDKRKNPHLQQRGFHLGLQKRVTEL